jgi:integrase
MAKHLLNDAALRAIKPTDKDQLISDGEGLFLLVKPDGKKWWRFVYTFQKKRKALSLGVYPQTTLSAARKEAQENRENLAKGINPSDLRKQDKVEKIQEQQKQQRIADGLSVEGSFQFVADEWMVQRMADKSGDHTKRITALLVNDVFPWLGQRPIQEITPPELLKVLRRIEDRNAFETAHRTLQVTGQIIRYAWATGLVEQDITQALKGALKVYQSGHFAAAVTPDKLRPLLRAIDDYSGSFEVKSALRLAPLVFVRPSELRQAEWEHIDFETKQWRYFVTKTKTDHIVPLSRQALAILQEIQPLTGHGRFIFPSARTPNGSRPMSDMALLAALRRMGFGKDEATIHGFRATARTLLDEELGFRVDYIEHQLAHAVKDANGRAYNRTSHLVERAKMMQVWSDYLDDLKAGAAILPFKQKTA